MNDIGVRIVQDADGNSALVVHCEADIDEWKNKFKTLPTQGLAPCPTK